MSCKRTGCGCGKDHGPVRDDEGPLEQDIERFSDVTRPCPACKKDVFDDAEVCYHCGHAFEGTSAGSGNGPPAWVMLAAGLVLVGFMLALLFRR